MIACLDLEGVLIPEIWIAFAEKTGIEKLKLTTRDIPDYDELMQGRLKVLDENKLTIDDIQEVIKGIEPLPGAKEYLDMLREQFQIIILSDTFYEFAKPLMKQLGYPTLFCHSLIVNKNKRIVNYQLRIKDGKSKAVNALKDLNFQVIASGDSYNDTGMLKAAHRGIFFRPPDSITKEFPQFPVAHEYNDCFSKFINYKKELESD
jgi:phosphoserine/homoserine phosphotransferase